MQKSVFTIETPERCEDCPCIGISAGCHVGYCKLAGKINSDYHVKIIPDWCPLMDLPEKELPKKPVGSEMIFPYNIFAAQKCANCGNPIIGNKIYKYCPECGQKIDWGEE